MLCRELFYLKIKAKLIISIGIPLYTYRYNAMERDMWHRPDDRSHVSSRYAHSRHSVNMRLDRRRRHQQPPHQSLSRAFQKHWRRDGRRLEQVTNREPVM